MLLYTNKKKTTQQKEDRQKLSVQRRRHKHQCPINIGKDAQPYCNKENTNQKKEVLYDHHHIENISAPSNGRCWREHGEEETVMYHGWEHKLVHPLWGTT